MTGFGQAASRATRLASLAAALQLGRPVTLSELRRRFDLYADGNETKTRRMFERDKADLRHLGYEVETVRIGDGDAYQIRRGPRPADVEWTDEEARTLGVLATAALDPDSSVAVAKVAAGAGTYPPLTVEGRVDLGVLPAAALTRALVDRRRVTFTYRNTKGQVAERTVEPWGLASRKGLTYLTGWDLDREAPRVSRTDRIESEVSDAGPAEHERPSDGLGVELVPDTRTRVEMEVAPNVLADARAMGAEVEEADGTVRAVFPGIREEVAVGWALRHRARVVSPEEVAADAEAARQQLLDVHSGDPSLAPLDRDAVHGGGRTRRAGLSDERLARLLTLPAWLESRPDVTVEEVAAAFSCEPEDIIDELELLDRVELPGIGNVFEREIDADGYIQVRTVVETGVAKLTPDDVTRLLSLVDAAVALLPYAGDSLRSIEKKLRDALPAGARGLQVSDLDRPLVGRLREALGSDAVLTIQYRGRRDDTYRERRVRPLQLQFIGGAVYLAAHDLDRDEARTFRVDRIAEVEDATEEAAAGERVPVPNYVPVDDEVEVELRLGARATWILALVPPTAVVEIDGGALHALVRTDVPDWLLAHVRAAGGAAEVLRPSELRDALVGSVGAHA